MARTVRDASLGSREARSKLAPGKRFYRGIEAGLHIGYRRARAHGRKIGGRWFCRVYQGRGTEQYVHQAIGTADDILDADGRAIFNFEQAQAKAREIFKAANAPTPEGGPLTVRKACESYVQYLKAERKSGRDAELRLAKHVLPKFGDRPVVSLKQDELERWKHGLVLSDPDDPDAERRSKDTANRLITSVKAALTRAFENKENGIPNDLPWRHGLKPFKKVDRPREVFLDEAQTQRLINVTEGAFRNFVIACLLSGARPPHELVAARVRDFHPGLGTLSVDGKTGKRDIVLSREGVQFFEEIIAGKEPDDLLLPKDDGTPWGKNHHIRPMQEAVKKAHLPKACTIYALRHTAASHALMAGMHIQLVAENLGTSVRMIERTYGKFTKAARRDLIEAGSLKLGLARGNVQTLGSKRGSDAS